MKKQPVILVVIMMMVTTIYALSLGNTGYSQQQGESSILDSIDVKNSNLTLGKPFYTEKFEFPLSQNNRDSNSSTSASSVYSFEGNGTLDNLQITASGNGN